jgi:two-component sensor histidine kinase
MLEVADDGVGFPAGLDFRRTDSLGLQIVVSLVKNLAGQIDMASAGGTTFKVVFPPLSS